MGSPIFRCAFGLYLQLTAGQAQTCLTQTSLTLPRSRWYTLSIIVFFQPFHPSNSDRYTVFPMIWGRVKGRVRVIFIHGEKHNSVGHPSFLSRTHCEIFFNSGGSGRSLRRCTVSSSRRTGLLYSFPLSFSALFWMSLGGVKAMLAVLSPLSSYSVSRKQTMRQRPLAFL